MEPKTSDMYALEFIERVKSVQQHEYMNLLNVFNYELNSDQKDAQERIKFMRILFTEELREKLNDISRTDSIKHHFFELILKLASYSQEHLIDVHHSGHLNEFFNEMRTLDPVYRIKYIQMITKLAQTRHGINYLLEQNHLQWLSVQVINTPSTDQLAHLILPEYFQIFAKIFKQCPNMVTYFEDVLKKLFESIDSSNPVILASAIDAIGEIGEYLNGKFMLNSYAEFNETVLCKIGQILTSHYGDIKLRGFETISKLLEIKENDSESGKGMMVTMKWYSKLMGSKENFTLFLINLSFDHHASDLKFASLNLVRILVSHSWGQKEIAGQSAFIEQLLDDDDDEYVEQSNLKIIDQILKSSVSLLINFDKKMIDNFKEKSKLTRAAKYPKYV